MAGCQWPDRVSPAVRVPVPDCAAFSERRPPERRIQLERRGRGTVPGTAVRAGQENRAGKRLLLLDNLNGVDRT